VNRKCLGIAAFTFMLVGALVGPAFAHHSFAMFDYNKETTLVGEVKEFKWANPHIHIYLKAPDSAGAMAEWEIEGATPDNLRRQGWSKETLKPGDKVTLVIHPLKNGTAGGMFVKGTYADGKAVGGNNR